MGDATTAYVCRGFVCDAPVGDVAALQAALRPPHPATARCSPPIPDVAWW